MERATVADLLRQTVEDGRAVVEAEIGVFKAIAAYRMSGIKAGAPLLLGAVFVAQTVLTVIFVGAILSLATVIGPGFATLLVAAVGLTVVGLMAWLGWRKLSAIFAPLPLDRDGL